MTMMKYVCELIQRHMTLLLKVNKTQADIDEIDWLKYKLRLVKKAQRKVIYGGV